VNVITIAGSVAISASPIPTPFLYWFFLYFATLTISLKQRGIIMAVVMAIVLGAFAYVLLFTTIGEQSPWVWLAGSLLFAAIALRVAHR